MALSVNSCGTNFEVQSVEHRSHSAKAGRRGSGPRRVGLNSAAAEPVAVAWKVQGKEIVVEKLPDALVAGVLRLTLGAPSSDCRQGSNRVTVAMRWRAGSSTAFEEKRLGTDGCGR